jgi:hypothetical protein
MWSPETPNTSVSTLPIFTATREQKLLEQVKGFGAADHRRSGGASQYISLSGGIASKILG